METYIALVVLLFCTSAISFAMDNPKPALPDFDAQWNYSDPAGTEKKFKALLEPAAASGDDEYYYCLQTQIARCQGLQGEFEKARDTLKRVEKVLESEDLPKTKVRYLLEHGRVFNSSGNRQVAARVFEDAFEAATKDGYWLWAVDAAHMVAIAESSPSVQIQWNQKCLDLIAAHPETERWKPSIWNNMGEAYRANRQPDKALECFASIIKWQTENGKPVNRYSRIDECKMLRAVGRGGEAMKKITQLNDEVTAAGEVDGFVCEELAENLLAAGDESAAKEQFVKAWSKLKDEKWIEEQEPQRYERLRKFGE